MQLTVHDTYSREKQPFVPQDAGRVTLYVCGPTVYNYAHVGNARPAVVFDVLFRVLRRLYGEQAVVYARNVTDVDDKIIARARETGEPIEAITAKYERIYDEDMAALGCLPPTLTPHATAHIGEMIDLIRRLIESVYAYEAEGHVLFDVNAFADYGRLSGRSLEDMIAGARVEVAPYKRNPADFVLWKPSKEGEPGWDSPWGYGRPGWHLECSAMIEKNLGLPVDIHGGGHDLTFPHHENEIAQGRCAGPHDVYARYWMHNGFLTMDAEKMSKSLGNVLLVHDLVKRTPGEVVRWALLSAHYRAPLDWTDALLEQSKKSLDRLYGVLQDARRELKGRTLPEPAEGEVEALLGRVQEGLLDDLNTPRAISALFELADGLRSTLMSRSEASLLYMRALKAGGGLLGLLGSDPDAWFEGGADEDLKAKVEALIAQRGQARASKDWAAADRIRAELTELGVEVMDGPQGATWRLREPA
ncbi:MAG TPA: cysteine--tRNA ligase [Caulobacteraceae bacterium]|jgi:cysteinyl-tRNA synthetase